MFGQTGVQNGKSNETNIKRNYKITRKFSFELVSEEFEKDIVNDLSSNRAAGGKFPLKILKECDFFFFFIFLFVHKKKNPTD